MTNPNEVEELKSCPFCGSRAEVSGLDKISCSNEYCGGYSWYMSEEKWNTRVSPPPSKEECNHHWVEAPNDHKVCLNCHKVIPEISGYSTEMTEKVEFEDDKQKLKNLIYWLEHQKQDGAMKMWIEMLYRLPYPSPLVALDEKELCDFIFNLLSDKWDEIFHIKCVQGNEPELALSQDLSHEICAKFQFLTKETA